MRDLAVVGGGYWGIACAHLARARGLDAVLIDDGNPAGATRNSAGICQQWWYKQEVASRRIPSDWDWQGPSLAWLDELGLVTDTGEMFFSRAKPAARVRDDCLLVDPWRVEALIEPVRARVDKMMPLEPGWLLVGEAFELSARYVIVTAGAWTDVLLDLSGLPPVGVSPLRGRALIVAHPAPLPQPITYLPRPYTHYTLRPWQPGQARIGDTVERGKAASHLPGLIDACGLMLGQVPRVLEVVDGIRPVCDRYVCDLLAPDLVVATGGHRVGLGLAEPVARRALNQLGIR